MNEIWFIFEKIDRFYRKKNFSFSKSLIVANVECVPNGIISQKNVVILIVRLLLEINEVWSWKI